MLDKYYSEQSLFCDEVNNMIKNNKIAHAYLIETNDYDKANELILDFIKTLFSINNKIDNINTLIDNNTYQDFLIIEPDGEFIKKEQISLIKDKFKTTSFSNNYRIYLINQADKMNPAAANSLLKFLEEPDGQVIAILVSQNRYKVIETLVSRCQCFSLINTNKNVINENIDEIVSIVKELEKRKLTSIAYLPILLENDYKDKKYWLDVFKEMINIYENALRKSKKLDFIDYGDVLDYIISLNTDESILKKIDVLFSNTKNMDYNLNVNMMIDNFIINFNGVD